MIELDFAFLADYARVDPVTGTITVVGASWTYLTADRLPAGHRMAVAGRVRAPVDAEAIPLRVEFVAPKGVYRMSFDGLLTVDPNARPYGPDNKSGRLFAMDVQLPLPAEGLYEVHLYIDGEHVRRLAFDVEVAPDGAAPAP